MNAIIPLTPLSIAERIKIVSDTQRQIDALTNDIDVLEEPIHVRIRGLMGHMQRYAHASGFHVEGDMLHFTATFAWENDEKETYAIPLRFITEPDVNVAREEYHAWAREQERIAAAHAMQEAGKAREAKERAEFERLRVKFEGNA